MGSKATTLAAALLLTGCYNGLQLGADSDGQASAGDTEGSAGSADSSGDTDGDTDAAPSDGDLDPGRVTLRRLNRTEYNNTIRDLFYGLDVSPADQFPAEDHSLGFDNIADALNITPLLFEMYERAAGTTVELALTSVGGDAVRVEAEAAGGTTGSECCGGFWNLSSAGEIAAVIDTTATGPHTVSVRAYGQQAGTEAAQMVVSVDGLEVSTFDVAATEDAPELYQVEVDLDAGAHQVVVAFTNDFYDADTGEDRNLLVDYVDLVPPGGVNDIRAKLLTCEPQAGDDGACTRQVLTTFTERAWRRPVTDAEIDRLMLVTDSAQAEGGTWEDGVRLAMKAVLVSPHFLFRVELDPNPTDDTPHPVDDFELASRLSYFMWSTMPDDELFDVARAQMLHDPAVLEEQVLRMLEDDKAKALVANFAGQWLYTRALSDELTKDYATYPEWDDELRDAMRTEMELFVQTFLTEGRSLDELLTADETFVNDRLAAFYGLDPVGTDEFVRVSLAGVPRRGLLTQAGLMSVLSHPNVTSPVKRGKWVLEQLLCITPPPPPPDAETTVDPSFDEGPMKDRLAKHRENPECAGCHQLMDPIGLSLEHYDGIGAWRETEGPWPIDASGELPSGEAFENGLQMAALLAQSPDFARCSVEKALIYGLGRDLSNSDGPFVDEIAEKFAADGHRLQDLILHITTSDLFTHRRGEPLE